MIVVFVIDTSPSMAEQIPAPVTSNSTTMSKLDLAKMTVESISKLMEKRIYEHNSKVQEIHGHNSNSHHSFCFFHNGYSLPDQFLLLSTGRQQHQHSLHSSYSSSAICGAGGRLLVGFGEYNESISSRSSSNNNYNNCSSQQQQQQQSMNHQFVLQQSSHKHEAFEKELKLLKATTWTRGDTSSKADKGTGGNSSSSSSSLKDTQQFPEDGGGSLGLNIALSTGLQLLSRYRLHNSATENFGLGRLPTNQNLIPNHNMIGTNTNNVSGISGLIGVGSSSSLTTTTTSSGMMSTQQLSSGTLVQATSALQPACLILLTDGECLRRPRSEGGGSLQLQFSMPLRELYREPFRWDQRTFCLGIGSSGDNLHPSLQALCDVTGGFHAAVKNVSNITQVADKIVTMIAPPIPNEWPLPDPLRSVATAIPTVEKKKHNEAKTFMDKPKIFVNGGPICCFEQFEPMINGSPPAIHRAMLFYNAPISNNNNTDDVGLKGNKSAAIPSPIWCIPESYFPSKKLDTLPPRTAQPILNYKRQYQILGQNTFDPNLIMRSIHRLEKLVTSNRILVHGKNHKQNTILQYDVYYCEWLVQKGGESNLRPKSEQGHEYFPVSVRGAGRQSLAEEDDNVLNIGILHLPHSNSGKPKPSTLTLLPPEPHKLLPLLLQAAEAENRALKKALEKAEKVAMDPTEMKKNLLAISKNILLDENWRNEFRAYLFRVPPYYTFSLRMCLRQILPSRCQSLISIDSIDNLVSQCFSRQCLHKIRNGEQASRENVERLERKEEDYRSKIVDVQDQKQEVVGYGHFDARLQTSNYLNALRHMPPPWKPGSKRRRDNYQKGYDAMEKEAMGSIFNMPQECLLAYFDIRRNWIFGGTGLTTRGLSVAGVNNCGTNVHRVNAKRNLMDEPLLSLVGVGASTIEAVPINKMGEFKGRLLYSKQPIVGWNDSTYSSTTTAADGSPNWSIGDDVFPLGFFDPKTAEFNDSIENRMRAKLVINFGNPFKEKRGDSVIPEAFLSQRPPLRKNMSNIISTVQGSPPHDAFSALVEGDGEALFVKTSPTHKINFGESDSYEEADRTKRQKTDDSSISLSMNRLHPPPPPKVKQHPINKPKPPPPSKAKQGQPPPPPPSLKVVGSNTVQSQKPPPPKNAKNAVVNNAITKEQNQFASANAAKKTPPKESPSPSEKPKVNLPPGWISVWSKSQQRWYYFDQRTNNSVWEWPPPQT